MRRAALQRRSGSLLRAGLVLAMLVIGGCAGITPAEYRDHREEGPEQGLFSGPDGEFVILAPVKGQPAATSAPATP